MSNLIFEFLNQELKLSKKIVNIEKDFSTGYYFAELFHKIGCLNSNIKEYKNEPKTAEEILNNFKKLKPEFSNLGIYIDNEIINLVVNQQKNIAANLIYKIRNKMIRKKINFEEIMNKMKITYKKLEEMKNKKEKFIRTSQNFFKKKSNLFIKSQSASNLSDFPLLANTNVPSLLNSKLKSKNFIPNNNRVMFPLKKELIQKNKHNDKTRNKHIEKLGNETSMKNINNINNEYNDKTMNEFINFTSLENNTFKLGLNILDMKPKLNRIAASSSNNGLIKTDIFKEKLKEKLEEYKIEKKDRTTQKERDLKHALKNSILKNIEKPMDLTSKKQFYRMSQYEKLRKKKFPLRTKKQIEEIKKNNRIFRSTFNVVNDTNDTTTENNWYKTCYMNIGQLKQDLNLSPKEYIASLNKKDIIQKRIKNENKRKRMKDDFFDIEDIVNLIIDISEEAYKYQNKTKEEFINLPEYKDWIELFIEGKSCIKINETIDMNMMENEDEEEDDNEKGNKTKINKDNINKENINDIKKERIKNEIIYSDFCNNEYIDYIYNRGYWNNELYIPSNYYGTQLQIYQILGEDLTKIIASCKDLFQGMIQINFNKMKNEEFELKEEEKENIMVPTKNERNEILGELIELNYDNNISEIKAENNDNNNSLNINMTHIPIKLCLIGTSFSGRRTQAELIHEKYPEITIYSINDMIDYYVKEYERLYINTNNSYITAEKKEKKNVKKKKENEEFIKEIEEEKKNFEKIKELIENYALKKEKDISDTTKVKLLINEIEKDFPYINEQKIAENIIETNKRKEVIEKEIEKETEKEAKEANNDINKKNNKNKNKEEKKVDKLKTELDDLNKNIYKGFILIDFPNNIQQHKILEEHLSGFIQQIEQYPNKRDAELYSLTDNIDKPYDNIINKEQQLTISAFDKYILLNSDEETIMNRLNEKLEEIREKKEEQKKKKEKKVEMEEWDEPDVEKIKGNLKKYNAEIPKIFEFLGNFKNLEIIYEKDKSTIYEKIENELINSIKLFEEKILKKNSNDSPNENNKYFKRLKEIKILIKKETSKNIIKNWKESKDKYMWNIKESIYNIYKLKEEIIKKMNSIQDDFIEFLNTKSEKEKIIRLFLNKYNIFIQNFSSIKNSLLVKEEWDKDIIELTENLWGKIQLRKKKAINELKNIKNSDFMKEKMEYFSEIISNLFYSEAEYYLNKINIMKQFYYELENKTNQKVEYKLKKSELMKNTNNLDIYVPLPQIVEIKKEKIKPRLKRYEEEEKEYLISPKIDKIYKNCYKLLFNYDKTLKEEQPKSNKKEGLFSLKRKKTKRYDFRKDSLGNNDNKIINSETELKTALNNEKIKYKLRLAFLKFYGEKFLEKLYNIIKLTFENMDKWIVNSVEAQNNAMNFIINKIKENILMPSFQEINDIILNKELDVFNIYEKVYHKFDEYNLKNYQLIKEIDKEFDLNELYKIYLELKSYEIQDNYVTLDSFIDILIKKHIFTYNSKGLMNCFKELPYKYFHKFILKFIIKTDKDQKLLRIDRLFTILCLMNENVPDNELITKMLKKVKNLIKYNYYLSKDNFFKLKFWFEPHNEKIEEKKEPINIKFKISDKTKKRRGSCFNKINKKPLYLMNETKNKRVYSPTDIEHIQIKNNSSNKKDNSKLNDKIISNDTSSAIKKDNKMNLKEILFLINQNYNNDINIFEFLDNITLKFSKKLKRKSTLKIKTKEQNSNNNNINQKHTYFENLIIN